MIELISTLTYSNPNLGERSIDGILHSSGIIVQRQRIRDALWSVDPEGVLLRLRRSLHRREYNVEATNSLWHVDEYHKLIRWKIVIHGGWIVTAELLLTCKHPLIIQSTLHSKHFAKEY